MSGFGGNAGSPAGPVNGILSVLQGEQVTLNAILQAMKALATPLGVFTTGSWTPALAFGGSVTGITYATQFGRFSQVGNLVICAFSIVLTSKGAQTGNATIAGLPVASGAVVPNGAGNGSSQSYSGMSGLTSAPGIIVPASSSSAQLTEAGATQSSMLTNANFGNGSAISGSFQYWTD